LKRFFQSTSLSRLFVVYCPRLLQLPLRRQLQRRGGSQRLLVLLGSCGVLVTRALKGFVASLESSEGGGGGLVLL